MHYVKRVQQMTVFSMLALGLAIGGLITATAPTTTAAAACVAPSANYGSATLKLAIPSQGTYRIWTRMQSPAAASNSFMMEVDSNSCYVVGGTTLPVNAWAWVNHQNGSAASTITAPLSAGTHTIKVIGTQPNIMIDRILAVADQACVPVNLGDNCMATADTTAPTVSITDPADNSTVSGVVTIKANASDSGGVSKVEFYIQNQLASTDTTAPYEHKWDTSNLNGSYTVTVKAYDVIGNSGIDSRAYTTRSGDTQAPSAPVALAGTAAAYNKVTLKWGASTDDSGAAGYRVVRNNITIATTTATEYTDTTVVAGTNYKYYVVAFDSSNNASDASGTVNITTPNPTVADTQAPSAPTDVNATAASNGQINIAWKASTDNIGIKDYDIYRAKGSDAAQKIATTATTSYGDSGLTAATTYRYYVIARDAAGNTSEASATASVTMDPITEAEGLGTIRGTVRGRNSRPISGARVVLWVDGRRYQATTNWRGRYVITDIPAGRYDATAASEGYKRSTERVRLRAGRTKWVDFEMRQNSYGGNGWSHWNNWSWR